MELNDTSVKSFVKSLHKSAAGGVHWAKQTIAASVQKSLSTIENDELIQERQKLDAYETLLKQALLSTTSLEGFIRAFQNRIQTADTLSRSIAVLAGDCSTQLGKDIAENWISTKPIINIAIKSVKSVENEARLQIDRIDQVQKKFIERAQLYNKKKEVEKKWIKVQQELGEHNVKALVKKEKFEKSAEIYLTYTTQLKDELLQLLDEQEPFLYSFLKKIKGIEDDIFRTFQRDNLDENVVLVKALSTTNFLINDGQQETPNWTGRVGSINLFDGSPTTTTDDVS